MAIKPIQRNNISDEVLEQIKNNILTGEWVPGMKIPGELELAELFGISRISVRKAIHRLVGMGVLKVKNREGTFVTEMVPSEYFAGLLPMLMVERPSLFEVQQFRGMIEIECARLAALKAVESDIQRMQRALDSMNKSKGCHEEFSSSDLRFHTSVAMASKNTVVIKVNSIIHDILKAAMDQAIKILGIESGIYHHGRILEAIEKRDPDSAASAMREHINDTLERIITLADIQKKIF